MVWPAVESSKCSSQFEKQSCVASAASATKILTLDQKTEEKKESIDMACTELNRKITVTATARQGSQEVGQWPLSFQDSHHPP